MQKNSAIIKGLRIFTFSVYKDEREFFNQIEIQSNLFGDRRDKKADVKVLSLRRQFWFV